MSRKVKAILIDPFACTIDYVEVDSLLSYYLALSHETMAVSTVTTARPDILKGRDALFVDDDGLAKQAQRWFYVATAHQSFAGKGLILGADRHGDAANVETSIDMIRIGTVFGEPFGERLMLTTMPWERPDENA